MTDGPVLLAGLARLQFDPIWVKTLLKTLVLPPTASLLVAILGLALYRRFPRTGKGLAWAGVLSLTLLSIPVVADLLLLAIDNPPVFTVERTDGARAIVILGGGKRNSLEYGGDTLGRLTLERVRYGARVAKLTSLPILVSGGSVSGGEAEARLMQQSLRDEYGIEVRWVEARSRNTHENALRSAEILKAAGIQRVILVAHAFDMPRATAEFSAAGIDTVPAATGIPGEGPTLALDYVPSIGGLQGSYYALYEIIANLVRRLSP
jgi:uncharacterized SAM-binding protein YcdF (DUF218 family)